jgi:hypothetical protein
MEISTFNKTIDYTKSGVVVSSTRNTKTTVFEKNGKQVKQSKTNTCFLIKNTGCSGLAKEFLR